MTENHKKFSALREEIVKRSKLESGFEVREKFLIFHQNVSLSTFSSSNYKDRWKYILNRIFFFMALIDCFRILCFTFVTFLRNSEITLAVLMLVEWKFCYFLYSAMMLYKSDTYEVLKETFRNITLLCVCDNCDFKRVILLKIERIRITFQIILVFILYPCLTILLPLASWSQHGIFEAFYYPIPHGNYYKLVLLFLGWILFAFVILQNFPQLNLCWLILEHLTIEFGVLREKCREVLNAEVSKQFSNEWRQRNEMIMYYCKKHEELCNLLDETNTTLQYNTSSLIMNMILGMCTLFYGIVNDFLGATELLFVYILPIILTLLAGLLLYRGIKLHQNVSFITF